MTAFKKFEDIKAWQKARQLTRSIYEATAEGAFTKDYGLREQVRRACVSLLDEISRMIFTLAKHLRASS